jgi:hypothetical protein
VATNISSWKPALLCLCLCGCTSDPPLAQGLPRPESGYDAHYFDARVKLRFPVGSDEQKLVAELRAERFKIQEYPASSGRYYAEYRIGGFVCNDVWSVWWSAQQGHLSEIQGNVTRPCL